MSSAEVLTAPELALVAELEGMKAEYEAACHEATADIDAEIAEAKSVIRHCNDARDDALRKVNSEYIAKVVEAGARHASGDRADRIIAAAGHAADLIGGPFHNNCSYLPDVARSYLMSEADKDAQRENWELQTVPVHTRWF